MNRRRSSSRFPQPGRPPPVTGAAGAGLRRRARPALLAAVALALLAAVGGSWRLWTTRPRTLSSGAVVGGLPSGVAPSNLNLLGVTLDTTRADRGGAYGYEGA